jgi:hypothetical protein
VYDDLRYGVMLMAKKKKKVAKAKTPKVKKDEREFEYAIAFDECVIDADRGTLASAKAQAMRLAQVAANFKDSNGPVSSVDIRVYEVRSASYDVPSPSQDRTTWADEDF